MKNASKISLYTMLSRLLGLGRDAVFTGCFSTSELGLFLMAYKIPQFLRRVFAEGAFSQAFIPVLKSYDQQPSSERSLYLNQVFSWLCVLMLVFALLGCCCPQLFIMLFAGGLMRDPDRYFRAVTLVRYLFPCVMLISISGFFTAALQARSRFTVPALIPAMQNGVFILVALLLASRFEVATYALVWGVVIASVLQVVWLWWGYRDLYDQLKLSWGWDKQVERTFILMSVGIYATSTTQIGVVLDGIILSYLASESQAWFYLAERLANLPQGLIAVSVVTVLSPSLSASWQAQNKQQFHDRLSWGVAVVMFLGVPAGFGLFWFSDAIATTLFFRGKFSLYDVKQVAFALRMLALGVPAFMLSKVYVAAFAAKQEMRYSFVVASVAVVSNISMSLIGVSWLNHAALALSMTLSSYLQVGLLWCRLYQGERWARWVEQTQLLGKILLACSSVLIGYSMVPSMEVWPKLANSVQLGYLMAVLGVTVPLYFGFLRVMSVRMSLVMR
ncbi:MAG: murein biosynthesis integral membrane protein MurJ [Pseudomonadota bacterium]|nr:murein biosynthesis integral membrane protein MurJ [Pseudomonadota bacterium]